MSDSKANPEEVLALKWAQTSLRFACAAMPHLSGLAAAVRLHADDRISTAAVSRTGRIVVNPRWFTALDLKEATFVMAHELLHLCLRTHERGTGINGELFNWAHDYVINDMLSEQLRQPVPAGGLVYRGAKDLSAEQMMQLIKSGKVPGPKPVARSPMTLALIEAGLLPDTAGDYGPGVGDVLTPDQEANLFPDADKAQEEIQRQRIDKIAERSLRLGVMREQLEKLEKERTVVVEEPVQEGLLGILRGLYRPPWEMILQQWLESVAPGPRTYSRPSRRSGDRTDVVLAGRRREGWTLHIVLDTSGSMVSEVPYVLGLIAAFCEGVNVTQIHVLQCDTRVTHDDWVDPEELARYPIAGGGGSDMSPAMLHLAADPEVESVLVITDGDISYPAEPPPYQVLWALTSRSSFDPGYGQRLVVERGSGY
jgi:predicted metal-dependent peptidase